MGMHNAARQISLQAGANGPKITLSMMVDAMKVAIESVPGEPPTVITCPVDPMPEDPDAILFRILLEGGDVKELIALLGL